MKKLFKEISIVTLIMIMLIALLQFPVSATNDELKIVKTEKEYLLYDESILNEEFQFAFANESTTSDASKIDVTTLNFINSIKDAEANNVAYVDANLQNTYFTDNAGQKSNAYIWIKQADKISDPILVNLDTAITQDVVDFVNNLTNKIPVTIGQEEREPVTEGNTTITTTVGYLQIQPIEGFTYEYQLIKLPNENYDEFVKLAKEISEFEENSTSYSNLAKIQEFYNLYNSLVPNEWQKVTNDRIEQPEDARNGEEYIVWVKATDENQEIVDIQFMTSIRKEAEQQTTETVKEEVTTTTKLPVTFDSNMILIIVFAVLIVAIIVLLVLKKKSSKKNN